MFVRVIQDRGQKETTFECVRATVEPFRINDGGSGNEIFLILTDEDGVELKLEYECADLEIIYMSNRGNTIDRKIYR